MRVWPKKTRIRAHIGSHAIREAARDILSNRTEPMLFSDLYNSIATKLGGVSYSLVAVALHTSGDFRSHGKKVGWTYSGSQPPPAPSPPPMPVPLENNQPSMAWAIGDRVAVKDVWAFVNGERRFITWSGEGTIDMIAYGRYFRVVAGVYFSWIGESNRFDQVQNFTAAIRGADVETLEAAG